MTNTANPTHVLRPAARLCAGQTVVLPTTAVTCETRARVEAVETFGPLGATGVPLLARVRLHVLTGPLTGRTLTEQVLYAAGTWRVEVPA